MMINLYFQYLSSLRCTWQGFWDRLINIEANKCHTLQNYIITDLTDGGFVADPVGHCDSQHSAGSLICGGEHRLLWKHF